MIKKSSKERKAREEEKENIRLKAMSTKELYYHIVENYWVTPPDGDHLYIGIRYIVELLEELLKKK